MSIVLEQDTFQRSNVASGWGTATNGHNWTTVNSAGTISVSSDVGLIANSNQTGANLLLGSASRTDAEILIQTSLSNANAASHQILRYVSAGNFYYAGQDLSGNLAIKVRVSDVGTTLVSTSNVVSANQKFWLRFRAQGTTLELKFWLDGNSEPAGWTLTTTDTTYAGGAIGYRGTCFSNSDTISLYSFTCTDLTSDPQNQLIADTFTRSNQSGFGTASDGEPWVQKDAAAVPSIASNRGQMTTYTASSNTVIGGCATYDTEMTIRFSCSAASSDALFFLARWTNNNNFYYVGFVQNNLAVRKFVAGSQSNVASAAFSATNNTKYWLHALVQGSNIKVKAWADGNSEPTSWTLTTTDSSLTEGTPGLRFFGSGSDIVAVDSLNINDPVSALSSTSSSEETLSGTMTAPPVTLSATLASAETLSGTLTPPPVMLSATLASAETLSGTLTPPPVTLSSTLASAETLNGIPDVNLKATLASAETLNGTMTPPPVTLSTTLASAETLSGIMTPPPVTLAATLASAETLNGTLTPPPVVLASVLASVETLNGIPDVYLAAILASAETLNGSLTTSSFISMSWLTRDNAASWITRDNHINWTIRG